MMIYLQMIETQEDRSVFERVYHRYRNMMYTVAYDILHNESDAEDAVHAAFVSIAEKKSKPKLNGAEWKANVPVAGRLS